MTEESKTPEGNVEVPKEDVEKGTKPAASAYSGPEPDPLPNCKIILCALGAILFFSFIGLFYGKLAKSGRGEVVPVVEGPEVTSAPETMSPTMMMTNVTDMDMNGTTMVPTMMTTNATEAPTEVEEEEEETEAPTEMDTTNTTEAPTMMTNMTSAPETEAPVEATDAPTEATEAPVEGTEEPVLNATLVTENVTSIFAT